MIDYVYTYFILSLWGTLFFDLEKELYEEMINAHEDNFDLEKEFIENNINDLGIIVKDNVLLDYKKVESKKIKKLVKKQSKKISKKVKNSIVNMLNTHDTKGLEELLKNNRISDSLVSDLMRIYRTENTEMRTRLKLDVQEQLLKQGIKVKRRWLHTLSNPNTRQTSEYTPREDHLYMNGQVENERGFFTTPSGKITKGPALFGLPEEDINCRCDVEFIIDK